MRLPLCVRIDLEDHRSAANLTTDGWREVQVLYTWRRAVPDFINHPGTSEAANADDLDECVELARKTMLTGRIAADPRCSPKDAADYAEVQVRSAFVGLGGGRRAHRANVDVRRMDGRIAGMLITDTDRIDMICVDDAYRRQHIARDMILDLLACMGGTFTECLVGTAAVNFAAIRLYESLGFTIVNGERTFHK